MFHRNEKIKALNLPGIWKIELRHEGKLILFKKFLVIPNENIFDQEHQSKWLNIFEQFWSFDSTCIKSIVNTQKNQTYAHGKMFKSCMESGAEWSTFYPDPKSDLNKY